MKLNFQTGFACILFAAVTACTKQAIKVPAVLSNESSGNATVASDSLYIGAHYGGGIIFWINNTGRGGLIAYPTDLPETATWTNPSLDDPYTNTGARRGSFGSGWGCTNIIISIYKKGDYAAYNCKHLNGDGYSDWYLPSVEELEKLYDKKDIVGGFVEGGIYWSSTEYDASRAFTVRFGPRRIRAINLKDDIHHPVRPIRFFK